MGDKYTSCSEVMNLRGHGCFYLRAGWPDNICCPPAAVAGIPGKYAQQYTNATDILTYNFEMSHQAHAYYERQAVS